MDPDIILQAYVGWGQLSEH